MEDSRALKLVENSSWAVATAERTFFSDLLRRATRSGESGGAGEELRGALVSGDTARAGELHREVPICSEEEALEPLELLDFSRLVFLRCVGGDAVREERRRVASLSRARLVSFSSGLFLEIVGLMSFV